jgi:ADA HAT complex component 1
MFRFWSSESKGSGRTVDSGIPSPDYDNTTNAATPVSSVFSPVEPAFSDRPVKRRRSSASVDFAPTYYGHEPQPAKRAKTDTVALLSPQSTVGDGEEVMMNDLPAKLDLDDAREAIEFQFGLEILLKHNELRLINQELAKCQIALEQLRRCHLIPYPVSCPTPEQMLEISSGKGPALQVRPGEPVPRWAPPFGVVDGPYARHYAKWLIPDPVFDGIQPENHVFPVAGRNKATAAEGRATRNSIPDTTMVGKSRLGRGAAGHKLQALSSGYPQPKDKQAPCILKRSDGQTVKLICPDCHRWDFSSTQGFINHCRIAHKREFKSHEEAAVAAGHPIELDASGGIVGDDKPAPPAVPASGLVHPLARQEAMTDQQAYAALLSRISASIDLFHAGKLPDVKRIPVSPLSKPFATEAFTGAPAAPYLSKLLQKRNFAGNLHEEIEDAKQRIDVDELWTPVDEVEDAEPSQPSPGNVSCSTIAIPPASASRAPAVMRTPARSTVSPVPVPTIPRPQHSKGQTILSALHVSQNTALPVEGEETPDPYDEMDIDLSPHTIASHNAPSLVSDDGEYDDSDDGSSSETSDPMDDESVSDVAEINLEEDVEETPRPIHRRNNSATTVKLGKEDAKHVTFVTPITGSGKVRRKQNV